MPRHGPATRVSKRKKPSPAKHAQKDGKPLAPNQIRAWRRYRGLTQEDLAAEIGLSAPYLSQVENARKQWNQSLLQDIADVLDTTVTTLLERPPPRKGERDPLEEWYGMGHEERVRALAVYSAAKSAARS